MTATLTCRQCSAPFTRKSNRGAVQVYCSPDAERVYSAAEYLARTSATL